DAVSVICMGLFRRLPTDEEARLFRQFVADALSHGLEAAGIKIREFMRSFPDAPPEVAIQHWAAFRKASRKVGAINTSRAPAELLAEMIEIHMENIAVAMLSSGHRGDANFSTPKVDAAAPFQPLFSTLMRRQANADETRILGQLGSIQVHHGS